MSYKVSSFLALCFAIWLPLQLSWWHINGLNSYNIMSRMLKWCMILNTSVIQYHMLLLHFCHHPLTLHLKGTQLVNNKVLPLHLAAISSCHLQLCWSRSMRSIQSRDKMIFLLTFCWYLGTVCFIDGIWVRQFGCDECSIN